MTRPTYENDDTRKYERFFLFLFPGYQKVYKTYGFDFCDVNSARIAEFKTRNYRMGDIPEGKVLLALHKVVNMLQYKRETGYTAHLYFMFRDKLATIEVKSAQPIRIMGRTDRNDPGDVEPCVLFDTKDMQVLLSEEELGEEYSRFAAQIA